jgi:hypothetical protein
VPVIRQRAGLLNQAGLLGGVPCGAGDDCGDGKARRVTALQPRYELVFEIETAVHLVLEF